MTTTVVFETHATTEDNESGRSTGWLPGRLSAAGRQQAVLLGERRRDDGLAAVFTSDLARAVQTVSTAFAEVDDLPVLHDWRLRECDYGTWNGAPSTLVQGTRVAHLDVPYPGGESWRQAVGRVIGALRDIATGWAGQRVLVVGHVATRWALDHGAAGTALETLTREDFAWRPGWDYDVTHLARPAAHDGSG
ncbi:histidine phosphatase family protein [Oryzihumus sp.]|uniref:histidine phosphatase family protein n=1 Tax=Oryzihumus sp. TaxID=1968903 RepID=UPI002EDAF26C